MHPTSLPDTDLQIPGLDKIIHLIMFIPFPVLTYLTITTSKRGSATYLKVILLAFIIGCLLATGTEYIQKHTGYRSFEIGDLIADFSGIFLGSLLSLSHLILNKKNDQ
jgi:VanZ family protein